MNPAYQGSIPPGSIPPGYHGSGVTGLTTTCSVGVPGVMSPLAYTHGVYQQVTPTYSVPGPLSASGHGTGAPGASGLLYDGSASHLMRSYGKSSPYAVPVTHGAAAAHAFQAAISSAPSQSQSAFSHTLTQSGTTLYSAQSAYPPALHPMAQQSSMIQAQARPLYLSNGSQQSVNPAIGISPALAARGSGIPTVPVPPQQTYYQAMLGAQQGANIYPGYYPPYVPGYQVNGAWP